MPREKRLTCERDYKRVRERGSFFSAGIFNIKTLKNNLGHSRIGIVVTKKGTPKATDRNKIKRQLREAARKLYPTLPAGYDVVITVSASFQKAEYEKIAEALKRAFERVRK